MNTNKKERIIKNELNVGKGKDKTKDNKLRYNHSTKECFWFGGQQSLYNGLLSIQEHTGYILTCKLTELAASVTLEVSFLTDLKKRKV